MRTVAASAVLVSLLVAGCASSDEIARPAEPGVPPPDAIPAAAEPVTTRPPTTPTVLDDGDGASLCLGGVMESMPPQCDGLPLAGWDWDDAGGFEERAGVRWGRYSLSGTFDGETLSVTEAVPAARYDTVRPEDAELAPPGTVYGDSALEGIVAEVEGLPGALSVSRDDEGRVLAEVVFDDGTLQGWAEDRYGEDVVVLTSALVPTSR